MAGRRQREITTVIAPQVTLASVTDQVSDLVLKRRSGLLWWLCLLASSALFALFIAATLNLFINGIGIWGVNIPVAWGFALANYVWWIGIASGGTIISALFYVIGSDWRKAVNRIAETITLFAAACAGLMPIYHLGRPGFFYWLFPYADVMGMWPQFRSPLIWDFFALLCYVLASIIFWYLGLVPDFAALRDRAVTRGKQVFYGVLALGWRGSSRGWTSFKSAYLLCAAIMAPMVVSVHSIVGLDFAGGLTPGWHSTQFPPYFVFGAVLTGFATVLLVIIPLRRFYGLKDVITMHHIDVLAKLMLTLTLLLGYAYAMEGFFPFYSKATDEVQTALDRAYGYYAWSYWTKIALNILLPQILWFPAVRQSTIALFVLSFLIDVGMWLERYLIVLGSLYRTFMPSAWYVFNGTLWDWATLIGSVGLFLTGIFIAVRLVPVVSISELRELIHQERR